MINKKGSLELSINAIVILILAITMLGLGLAFMKGIFGKATAEFSEVTGTVKKQMIDQMKESGKIVDISSPRVEIKAGGDKKQVYVAFKNDQEGTSPEFQIREVIASRLGSSTETNTYKVDLAGVVDISGATTLSCGVDTGISNPGEMVYIQFKRGSTTVSSNEVFVLPINIDTQSSASKMTCLYEIKVDDGQAAGKRCELKTGETLACADIDFTLCDSAKCMLNLAGDACVERVAGLDPDCRGIIPETSCTDANTNSKCEWVSTGYDEIVELTVDVIN